MNRNTQLESTLQKMCNSLVLRAKEEIKKCILQSRNVFKQPFWFGEEKIIEQLFLSKQLQAFFAFKEYWFDPGQPFPNSIFRIYYSEKYDFYYTGNPHIYPDFEFIKTLVDDNLLEICSEKPGISMLESTYIENPRLVLIYSFENPKFSDFKDLKDIKVQYGFYEFLENICQIDTSVIRKVISNCQESINKLSTSASFYAKEDETFKKELFNNVFESIKDKYSEEENNFVFNSICECKYSDTVIRMLLTYNYTNELYKKYPNDYVDLTFITVSLYKIVEILMCNFINEHFGSYSILMKNGKMLDLSEEDLTLGEMNQIFYTDNSAIRSFLKRKSEYSSKLKTILSAWIKYSRNGFLHKHLLNNDKKTESELNSLDVLFYVMLVFSD